MTEDELTEVCKTWLQGHHPHAWAVEFIELTCLGIPYRTLPDVDGKPTVKEVSARQ